MLEQRGSRRLRLHPVGQLEHATFLGTPLGQGLGIPGSGKAGSAGIFVIWQAVSLPGSIFGGGVANATDLDGLSLDGEVDGRIPMFKKPDSGQLGLLLEGFSRSRLLDLSF